MHPTNPSVLVVGAGPTGLTLANQLQRQGARFDIIDHSTAASSVHKAIIVHARTMELLEDLGLADLFVARGRPLRAMNIFSAGKRRGHIPFDRLPSRYPYMLALPQPETERLLTERLEAAGGGVSRGVGLRSLEQSDDQVTVTLERVDGQLEERRYDWVVGCDGAHSTVRKQLGLDFEGHGMPECFLVGAFDVAWDDNVGDEGAAFISPRATVFVCPVPPTEGSHYRVEGVIHGEAPEPDQATFERLAGYGGLELELSNPSWMTQYRVSSRIVPKYRVGRVLLAGDAAHIHMPTAGQGMNLGMQDGYNLGWKLGLVCTRRARADVLDSYEEERRPRAAATVKAAAKIGRLMITGNPMLTTIRNLMMPIMTSFQAVQSRGSQLVSGLSLAYGHSSIVGQHRSSLLKANVGRDAESETPSVGDWFAFGGGPAPGQRLADLDLGEDGLERLYASLTGAAHTVLLFDGAADTPEGYRNMADLGAALGARYGDAVRVVMVLPHQEQPAALHWSGPVLLDVDGRVHAHFGVRSDALYVVRPDYYVGFRSQPAVAEPLIEWFDRVLVPLAP